MVCKVILFICMVGYCTGVPAPELKSSGQGGQGGQSYNQIKVQQSKSNYGNDFQTKPNYDFSWYVNDKYSGNDYGQQETRNGYDTSGKYWVLLPDGRRQNVKYWVNGKSGFVADVTYEGTAVFPEQNQYGRSDNVYSPSEQVEVQNFQDLGLKSSGSYINMNVQPNKKSFMNTQSDFQPSPRQIIKSQQNVHPFQKSRMFNDQALKSGMFNDQALKSRMFKDQALKSGRFNDQTLKSRMFNDQALKSGMFNAQALNSGMFNDQALKSEMFNDQALNPEMFNDQDYDSDLGSPQPIQQEHFPETFEDDSNIYQPHLENSFVRRDFGGSGY